VRVGDLVTGLAFEGVALIVKVDYEGDFYLLMSDGKILNEWKSHLEVVAQRKRNEDHE
tara:strand:+ start:1164 stop:1337 length:174 start_codon:yes stop_codon:yes gene_type:complete